MSRKHLLEERIEDASEREESSAKKKTYRVNKKPNVSERKKDTDRPEKEPEKKENYLTQDDIEELKYLEQMQSDAIEKKTGKRARALQKAGVALMSCLCIYVVMLIYGVIVTDYSYNETGEVSPTIVTVESIEKRNEYNSLVVMYMQIRNLYEKLLLLDYRIGLQEEDPKTIAPEYQKAIDDVDALNTQIESAILSSQYNQVRMLMKTLVNNHMFSYCQYISMAITENSEEAETQALLSRETIEKQFMLITENVIKLGELVPGYDLSDLKRWSPEGYIMETTGSIS